MVIFCVCIWIGDESSRTTTSTAEYDPLLSGETLVVLGCEVAFLVTVSLSWRSLFQLFPNHLSHQAYHMNSVLFGEWRESIWENRK